MKYSHHDIESKWQAYWEKKNLFAASDKSSKPKYYCLIEFPYPSGEGLHVGHPRSYTALDILARKRRMQGFNVLYPIGFDAFGLPSENYAIKTGIHPTETTKNNIETFTHQLKALGFSFDWNRVVRTTDPEYYKWTQWIFIQLWKRGLAYKDTMAINWCPSCKIGLANEEVVNGHCERCGHVVEKREKKQWMLKITNYADRLINDLETVDYPERVKAQQLNWIGRSDGANIYFSVDGLKKERIEIFTTRPDTVFGATFMVLSPEHPIISNLKSQISNLSVVEHYITQAKNTSELERTDATKIKTGVPLEGVYAINPANNRKIPIWIADYVLMNYGTGAIMAVPGHDQRDWEFAKKFGLPVVEVVSGGDVTKQSYTDNHQGTLINSGQFDGLTPEKAILSITAWLEQQHTGSAAVNYKLRDWVFSRQRYWGEPIPMIYCENCKTTGASADGWHPVPEKQLPVTLPDVKKYEPTDDGESPLAAITAFVNVKCPVCGGQAQRETDTMPNWAGSNWYFLRYVDPGNKKALADDKKLAYWMPVNWYNGGMEHTTLHLLYSRFIYKFLWDIGAVPESCGPEPYRKRTSHGFILGENNEKMSKSRGNVVNPDDVVREYGADTLRLYEMFMGPFSQTTPWSTKGVRGVRRFIEKIWFLYSGGAEIVRHADDELVALTHRTIKKVSEDIETQDYNTAVSAMMILANKIQTMKAMDHFVAEALLKILTPFAPHVAEELWNMRGHKKSIMFEDWPGFNEALIEAKEITLVVQVNGKVRGTMVVPVDITQQKAEVLARQSENVATHLAGKDVRNVIFVPGRLINFVLD